MKNFLTFLLLVLSIFSYSYSQSLVGNKTTLPDENTIIPQVNIIPGEGSSDFGNLLTNGVLVTTFPDYAGNATPMGIAFDGTNYYVIPGGFSSDDVAQLDVNFNLVTTQTVGLDMRSIFYNPNDGEVYVKDYSLNGLFRLHTNPFDGGYDVIFTGIFQDTQTKVCLSADGTKMYEQFNGTARVYDFATGAVLNTFSLNLQHDLTWPRGNIIAYSGTYLLTYAHPVVYAYDVNNGSFVSSCTLGTQPSSDEWSICYTNGMFMLTDVSDGTWYVWTVDQGVPVELTSFTAASNNNQILLNWSTATETNNQGFDVQRKSLSGEYVSIGFVPGAGTTTEVQSYSFTDENISAGNYIYRLKQIDFDGTFEYSNEVNVDVTTPGTFSLEQNYPNPFNPSTNISYSITEDGFVKLAVYNMLGEEVALLVNESKSAGTYNINFAPADLPTGTYVYQLQSGNFVENKKMLLLK